MSEDSEWEARFREANERAFLNAEEVARLREEVSKRDEALEVLNARLDEAEASEAERDRLREALERIADLSGPITVCWFDARAIVAQALEGTSD